MLHFIHNIDTHSALHSCTHAVMLCNWDLLQDVHFLLVLDILSVQYLLAQKAELQSLAPVSKFSCHISPQELSAACQHVFATMVQSLIIVANGLKDTVMELLKYALPPFKNAIITFQ